MSTPEEIIAYVNTLKVVELRDELKKRHLSYVGNKPTLAQRLREDMVKQLESAEEAEDEPEEEEPEEEEPEEEPEKEPEEEPEKEPEQEPEGVNEEAVQEQSEEAVQEEAEESEAPVSV